MYQELDPRVEKRNWSGPRPGAPQGAWETRSLSRGQTAWPRGSGLGEGATCWLRCSSWPCRLEAVTLPGLSLPTITIRQMGPVVPLPSQGWMSPGGPQIMAQGMDSGNVSEDEGCGDRQSHRGGVANSVGLKDGGKWSRNQSGCPWLDVAEPTDPCVCALSRVCGVGVLRVK